MATRITASFEVKSWKEEPLDERPDAAKLTTALVTKTYGGKIEGSSVTAWLMAYADDGSATFVGLERITGTIDGREGSLVLQHVGKYEADAATADLVVVAGCGSDGLAGVTGKGSFRADPKGSGSLDLELP